MNTPSLTCSKLFGPYPAAHRQHTHDGHCAFIHGHDWKFQLTFACAALDDNGFVVDFGKLGWIKAWLTHMFDHTLLLNRSDPCLVHLQDALDWSSDVPLADIRQVDNCGAEGLAVAIFSKFDRMLSEDPMLAALSDRGVRIIEVRVYEDEKNFATYRVE